MNELIDTIDKYLDGKMSASESRVFEDKIKSDTSLNQMVESQRNLRAGMERLAIKSTANHVYRKITLRNKIYKWGIASIVVAAAATSGYLLSEKSTVHEAGNQYVLPATNEIGGSEWADADRNLPTTLFSINPNKDTVIETPGGIIFAIPAGAFVNSKTPVTVEIREALTPFDIMKAGLSTSASGEPLITGGMFYLNAREGEKTIQLNPQKPICANIPTAAILPGMQLFDGERKADGSINWVNPRPMEKQLIPVDIYSLDFYPHGFANKVAELGFNANSKKVTDSIYYSYSGRQNEARQFYRSESAAASPPEKVHLRVIRIAAKGSDDPKSDQRELAEQEKLADEVFALDHNVSKEIWAQYALKYSSDPSASDGRGGDYGIVTKNMISNKVIRDAVWGGHSWDKMKIPSERGWYILQQVSDNSSTPVKNLEIDPARIAALQTEKFQNTIIATKEFEERLQVIFHLGNPELLDLYVNNLDKKLYQIDSLALNMVGDEQFEAFYSRRDGGIDISRPHLLQLQDYYQKKQEAVRLATEQTYKARKSEQRKQDSLFFALEAKKDSSKYAQWSENLIVEFEINLRDVKKQLGIVDHAIMPTDDVEYYSFNITTPGWKNVDAYVFEATVKRTSMNYTDPNSGRKATLTYDPLNIQIIDAMKYSQVMVYLVADSLPNFMRLQGNNGMYTEKLNALFKYSLVVIAENKGSWFYAMRSPITPGNTIVKLQSTTEESMRKLINGKFKGSLDGDFDTDITFLRENNLFQVRKEKEKRQEQIDSQILPVIFPFFEKGYTTSDPIAPNVSYQ